MCRHLTMKFLSWRSTTGSVRKILVHYVWCGMGGCANEVQCGGVEWVKRIRCLVILRGWIAHAWKRCWWPLHQHLFHACAIHPLNIRRLTSTGWFNHLETCRDEQKIYFKIHSINKHHGWSDRYLFNSGWPVTTDSASYLVLLSPQVS